MIKPKSLPGYVLTAIKPGYLSALLSAADIFDSKIKPIAQVNTDGSVTDLHLMNSSTALVGHAIGAFDYDLPHFRLVDHVFADGSRRGYLMDNTKVHPSIGIVSATCVSEIKFTTLDVDFSKTYYVDEDGNEYRLAVV